MNYSAKNTPKTKQVTSTTPATTSASPAGPAGPAGTKPGRGMLMIEPGVPAMKKGGACKLLPNIPKGRK